MMARPAASRFLQVTALKRARSPTPPSAAPRSSAPPAPVRPAPAPSTATAAAAGTPPRSVTWRTRAKSTLDILAALATIGGIAFAIQQYLSAINDARINQTLSYVARFDSDPILPSLVKLYQAYEKNPQVLTTGDPTAAEIDFIQHNRFEWDAVVLGDFFDQLYVCLSAKICDQGLAVRLLGRDIEGVYVLTGRYLTSEHPPTGCGLAALFRAVHPMLKYARLSAANKRGTTPPGFKLGRNACPEI